MVTLTNSMELSTTRRFNTELTRALYLYLSLARQIKSTSPHPTSPKIQHKYYPPTYILVFLAVSFPLAFPPITYTRSCSPHSCYMPRCLILLDLIILILLGEGQKSRSSSLCIHEAEWAPYIFISATYN
jgi:hypothetical protein